MTNREWISSMTNEQLAMWLSTHYLPCMYCDIRDDCLPEEYIDCQGTPLAWEAWFEAEHEEE